MACIRDIRKSQEENDALFEPMKDTVQLLASYKISLPESTLKKLDDAPHSWEILKKKMAQSRDALQEVQLYESREIRSKSDDFQVKVENFRKQFLSDAPFSIKAKETSVEDVKAAYKSIDDF